MIFREFPAGSLTVFFICEMEKEQMTFKVSFSFITVGLCLRYLFSANNVRMFNPNHFHLACVLFYNHHGLHPPSSTLHSICAAAKDMTASMNRRIRVLSYFHNLSWKPLQFNKNSPRMALGSPFLHLNSSSTWSKSLTLAGTQFPQWG